MVSESVKCVYVAVHTRMRDLVKVGRSKNLKKRVSVLNTSVPEDFDVVMVYKTDSYVELEKLVVKKLIAENLHKGSRTTKEFFNCDAQYIKHVINQIVDEHTNLNGSYLDDETIQNLLRRAR